ncbi:MAG TPA: substrate-binding domain-containing protein [Micropepsaceae bacterium]|nr:substrate-binding domain-containing protein [Micropepsaceae bacterium]
MRILSQRISLFALCVVMTAFGRAADATEIKLVASNAVKEAYTELLPAYEKSSGNKVTVSWGGTADISKRINDGEPADIVIITETGIDGLVKQGKLAGAGRISVAKSPTGAAVRAGAPKPDLSSVDALKKTLIASKAIVVTPGPSNPFLHQLFDKLGIGTEMKAKEVHPAAGEILSQPVIDGKADIVFSLASELINVKGMDYVRHLPPGAEIVLNYVAALHTAAAQPEAAKGLLRFLTTPDAQKVLKRTGLEPG